MGKAGTSGGFFERSCDLSNYKKGGICLEYLNLMSKDAPPRKLVGELFCNFVSQDHCQKALRDISTRQSVGLFWVPGHSGVRGNEIGNGLAREGTVHQFVGPEPALWVSRQNIRKKIKRFIDRQHTAMW